MPEDLEQIKHAPTSTGVTDLILRRWSPRSFSAQPIPPEALTKIFTAAAWAASSSNEQPWRFLVGRKGDDTYAKILDSLVDANRAWAASAPVLVLSAARKTFAPKNGKTAGEPNPYALHDTGAASATMSLEAIALGIHTHGMGGFDRDKARAYFQIPAEFELGACWALGYLGSPDALTADWQREAETSPRTRKPLADFVFNGWNTPATF